MSCPTPDKVRHPTADAAADQLWQMRRGLGRSFDSTARAYPCQCGGWHVGRPTLNRRIREALRSA